MTVREVDGGKRREDKDCGCAWLYEPPAETSKPWAKRQVARCGTHRKSGGMETGNVGKPPEVSK